MESTLPTLKTDVFVEQINTVPGILQANETSVNLAVKAGNDLIAVISQQGMNDDLDTKANDLLVKIRKTHEKLMDRRKPVTSLFDSVKKIFTGFEAQIDPKSSDNVYGQLQKFRNDYATKKAQEAARARAEAERKLNADKAKIDAKAHYESELRKAFDAYVFKIKSDILSTFEGLTLENFKERSELLKNLKRFYSFSEFEKPVAPFNTPYLSGEEIKACLADAKAGKFENYAAEFKTAIDEHLQYYVDRLTSKYRELHELASKDAVEKERLQAEADKRAAEEIDRLKREETDKANAAQAAIEANKNALTANTFFDAQSATVTETQANVREGYEITVTHPAGWQLIIAKYFEKEGLMMPVDELGKKTLNQMKTFCEKLAKNGETINSPYLRYKEVYKAVAKK